MPSVRRGCVGTMMHELPVEAFPHREQHPGTGSASIDDLREPGGGVRLLAGQHVPVLRQREGPARMAEPPRHHMRGLAAVLI